MHIMNINTAASHLWNNWVWGGQASYFWDNRKCPQLPSALHKICLFLSPPIFQIWYLVLKHWLKSNHRNLLTTWSSTLWHMCHQWHSRFWKILNQTFGAPRPSTGERDVAPWWEGSLKVQWVIGSILHGGPIELFLIRTSAPRLV